MLQTIEGECRQSLLLRLKNYVHQLPLPPHSKLEVVRSLRESWIKRNSVDNRLLNSLCKSVSL